MVQSIKSIRNMGVVGLENEQILLPVEFCNYAFHHNVTRELRLLLFFKFYCKSCVNKKSEIFKWLRKNSIGHSRTFDRNLKKLITKNWIGYNMKNGNHFIRSFEYFSKELGFQSRTGCYLHIIELQSFRKFRAFCFSAIVGSYINYKKRKWAYLATREKRREIQPGKPFIKYFGLSIRLISKIINSSIANTQKIKNDSIKYGYLTTNPKYAFVNVRPGLLPSYWEYKAPKKTKVINGKVFERCFDEIIPNQRFKKRR